MYASTVYKYTVPSGTAVYIQRKVLLSTLYAYMYYSCILYMYTPPPRVDLEDHFSPDRSPSDSLFRRWSKDALA